jgi:hypothetical protein
MSNDGRCANLIAGDNIPMTDSSLRNITRELQMTVSNQYPRHSKSKVDGKASNPHQILHKVDEHYISVNPHLISVYYYADNMYFISMSL